MTTYYGLLYENTDHWACRIPDLNMNKFVGKTRSEAIANARHGILSIPELPKPTPEKDIRIEYGLDEPEIIPITIR